MKRDEKKFKLVCNFAVLSFFLTLNYYKTHHFKTSFIFIFILIIYAIFIGGCGTTKNFVVQSNPKSALIITKYDDSNIINYHGETPTEIKLTFSGDKKYYITAEKRGYMPSNQAVTEDSDVSISFDLDRIEGVPEEVFDHDNLLSETFILLPGDIEIIIHSGLGRLDRYEHSSDLSKKVTENFNTELIKAFNKSNKQNKQLPILNASLKEDWKNISGEIKKYISMLDPKTLNYSSLPPYINRKVEYFKTLTRRVKEQNESDSPYLLYIPGICVSETAGRQVGNFILSVLGAGVASQAPTYYDPSAFKRDTGTHVSIAVIDADTSEVLYLERRYFGYNITDFDDLKKLANLIGKFPNIPK